MPPCPDHQPPSPELNPPRSAPLRLRVTARAESRLRSGHPWLFAESIRNQNRTGQTGELGVIYDRQDRFLALGLFDAESPIRLRVLHAGKPQAIDRVFWQQKLEAALTRRNGLFGQDTTGFRWIHGESDGWPGFVLDRYDSCLVLKLYTAAWAPWLPVLRDLIVERLRPERIVLRLSRNIQEFTRQKFDQWDGQMIHGPPLDGPIRFLESGLRFEAEVSHGQKTGFFLDQRENRRKIEAVAGGRAMLNAFSFSGAFSLYAARGGAAWVTNLDISPHALAAAQRNFGLNASERLIQACPQRRIQADAFDWLAANPREQFNLLVLDPPSMARRESERAGAIAAYCRLARLGLSHLRRGGILLACSCSAHVAESEFFEAVRNAASQSRRPFHELARTGQPPDHPALFPESKYLKAIYLRLD